MPGDEGVPEHAPLERLLMVPHVVGVHRQRQRQVADFQRLAPGVLHADLPEQGVVVRTEPGGQFHAIRALPDFAPRRARRAHAQRDRAQSLAGTQELHAVRVAGAAQTGEPAGLWSVTRRNGSGWAAAKGAARPVGERSERTTSMKNSS